MTPNWKQLTCTSMDRWYTNKYPYHEILLSNKQEQTTDTCNSLNEMNHQGIRQRGKKSQSTVCMLSDSIHTTLLK